VLAVIVIARSVFVVDESELALVVSFGRVVDTVTKPGLNAKWPWHSVRRFDGRMHLLDPEPRETLTGDPKNIVVDPFAVWRIEPDRLADFVRTVRDTENADRRLAEVIWHALTVELSGLALTELVNEDASKLRLEPMLDATRSTCMTVVADFGIRLIDVRLKRITRPEGTKDAVYREMIAERAKEANFLRKEGERRAIEIRAKAREEADKIVAQAEGEAQVVRGRGEAEATRTYGEAHAQDPEFFLLQQLLETYREIIDTETTLVLSGDSDLLRLLTAGRTDALPKIDTVDNNGAFATSQPAESNKALAGTTEAQPDGEQ
jgi:membrane protease subunit HflC